MNTSIIETLKLIALFAFIMGLIVTATLGLKQVVSNDQKAQAVVSGATLTDSKQVAVSSDFIAKLQAIADDNPDSGITVHYNE